jgi:DNA-binding FrmR family transcriptional regulator
MNYIEMRETMEQEKKYCDNETTADSCTCSTEPDASVCNHRTKERSDKEYRDLQNRLSRIEGQVRGVKKMLENNAYCPDILVQVSAINAALNSFNRVLLANHIRTCVATDIREDKPDTIDEFVTIIQKLMR